MAQFTIYKSTDASAPVLNGTSGALVAVINACLVDGYGSKSPAGWTKTTGASKAAYQQGAGSVGHYMRVQDDGPGGASYCEARITGYESMSDVDTGTNPYPTAAQGAGGVAMFVARKSVSADSTPRPWIIAADSRTFYLWMQTGDTGWNPAGTYTAFFFGEFFSVKPTTDSFRNLIIGRYLENSNNLTHTGEFTDGISASITSALSGHVIARSYSGGGASIVATKGGDNFKGGGVTYLLGVTQYPNGTDNSLYMSPVWIAESAAGTVRGTMRGFWHICHAIAGFSDGDTFSGANELAGKAFMLIKISGNAGIYCIETSNTLDSN